MPALEDLPAGVVVTVLTFLPAGDLGAALACNRELKVVAARDELWEPLAVQRWEVGAPMLEVFMGGPVGKMIAPCRELIVVM
jgi:hypothetical protein